MNINAIKRNCVAANTADLLHMIDCGQWISNGYAAWPVDGLKLSLKGLESLFNLKPKKWNQMIAMERNLYDPRYTPEMMEGDEYAGDIGRVIYMDAVYIALNTSGGIMYIPEAPIAHIKDDVRSYAVRWENGKLPLIAVCVGMVVGALVVPEDNVTAGAIAAMAARMSGNTLDWQMAQNIWKWGGEADSAEEAAERMAQEMNSSDV